VIYRGYANIYSLKHNGKSITLAPLSLPKPHTAKLGKGSKNWPYKSETREECATSKSKPQIALQMTKLNTSEEVEPFPLISRRELKVEIP